MDTKTTKGWFGKRQLWITIFAGFMFFLTAAIAAGNANTVMPFLRRCEDGIIRQ